MRGRIMCWLSFYLWFLMDSVQGDLNFPNLPSCHITFVQSAVLHVNYALEVGKIWHLPRVKPGIHSRVSSYHSEEKSIDFWLLLDPKSKVEPEEEAGVGSQIMKKTKKTHPTAYDNYPRRNHKLIALGMQKLRLTLKQMVIVRLQCFVFFSCHCRITWYLGRVLSDEFTNKLKYGHFCPILKSLFIIHKVLANHFLFNDQI